MTIDVVLLLANGASTLMVCGLIWTIQIVHYPSFHYVTPERFAHFEAFHQRRISMVVVPLMLMELVTSLGLLWYRPDGLPVLWSVFGVVLVVLIWATTFTLQVPLHNRLSEGYDKQAITALVTGNWLRTLIWSLRGLLVLYAMAVIMMGDLYPN